MHHLLGKQPAREIRTIMLEEVQSFCTVITHGTHASCMLIRRWISSACQFVMVSLFISDMFKFAILFNFKYLLIQM